jgi:threonine dehydratase
MSTSARTPAVTLESIREAAERIAPVIVRTPLKPSLGLTQRSGSRVWLKLETAQPTGAFKLRGAANAILSLPDERRRCGVVTASAGNHGRAVAYVARELGVPCHVFLSRLVPANKVAAIRDLGAAVNTDEKDYEDACARAAALAQEEGLAYVHAFDDPDVTAGQGTIGLEILEDLPEVETIVVPVSGGGLIAGIAVAAKALNPSVRIVGVSMERGAAMAASLAAGRPVAIVEEETLADALSGSIGLDNHVTFPLVRDLVDDLILLPEDRIAAAMVHALRREKLVLEGGAACTLAVLLDPPPSGLGRAVAGVCSGDNVDIDLLLRLAAERDDARVLARRGAAV